MPKSQSLFSVRIHAGELFSPPLLSPLSRSPCHCRFLFPPTFSILSPPPGFHYNASNRVAKARKAEREREFQQQGSGGRGRREKSFSLPSAFAADLSFRFRSGEEIAPSREESVALEGTVPPCFPPRHFTCSRKSLFFLSPFPSALPLRVCCDVADADASEEEKEKEEGA